MLAPVCKMVRSFALVSTCEASSHLAIYAHIKFDKRYNHLEGSHGYTVQGVKMVGKNQVCVVVWRRSQRRSGWAGRFGNGKCWSIWRNVDTANPGQRVERVHTFQGCEESLETKLLKKYPTINMEMWGTHWSMTYVNYDVLFMLLLLFVY